MFEKASDASHQVRPIAYCLHAYFGLRTTICNAAIISHHSYPSCTRRLGRRGVVLHWNKCIFLCVAHALSIFGQHDMSGRPQLQESSIEFSSSSVACVWNKYLCHRRSRYDASPFYLNPDAIEVPTSIFNSWLVVMHHSYTSQIQTDKTHEVHKLGPKKWITQKLETAWEAQSILAWTDVLTDVVWHIVAWYGADG